MTSSTTSSSRDSKAPSRRGYLASVRLVHNAFSNYHEEIEFVVADERWGIGDSLTQMQPLGLLG